MLVGSIYFLFTCIAWFHLPIHPCGWPLGSPRSTSWVRWKRPSWRAMDVTRSDGQRAVKRSEAEDKGLQYGVSGPKTTFPKRRASPQVLQCSRANAVPSRWQKRSFPSCRSKPERGRKTVAWGNTPQTGFEHGWTLCSSLIGSYWKETIEPKKYRKETIPLFVGCCLLWEEMSKTRFKERPWKSVEQTAYGTHEKTPMWNVKMAWNGYTDHSTYALDGSVAWAFGGFVFKNHGIRMCSGHFE